MSNPTTATVTVPSSSSDAAPTPLFYCSQYVAQPKEERPVNFADSLAMKSVSSALALNSDSSSSNYASLQRREQLIGVAHALEALWNDYFATATSAAVVSLTSFDAMCSAITDLHAALLDPIPLLAAPETRFATDDIMRLASERRDSLVAALYSKFPAEAEAAALVHKNEGNTKFAAEQFATAIASYRKGMQLLPSVEWFNSSALSGSEQGAAAAAAASSSSSSSSSLEQLLAVLYSNTAQCNLGLKEQSQKNKQQKPVVHRFRTQDYAALAATAATQSLRLKKCTPELREKTRHRLLAACNTIRDEARALFESKKCTATAVEAEDRNNCALAHIDAVFPFECADKDVLNARCALRENNAAIHKHQENVYRYYSERNHVAALRNEPANATMIELVKTGCGVASWADYRSPVVTAPTLTAQLAFNLMMFGFSFGSRDVLSLSSDVGTAVAAAFASVMGPALEKAALVLLRTAPRGSKFPVALRSEIAQVRPGSELTAESIANLESLIDGADTIAGGVNRNLAHTLAKVKKIKAEADDLLGARKRFAAAIEKYEAAARLLDHALCAAPNNNEIVELLSRIEGNVSTACHAQLEQLPQPTGPDEIYDLRQKAYSHAIVALHFAMACPEAGLVQKQFKKLAVAMGFSSREDKAVEQTMVSPAPPAANSLAVSRCPTCKKRPLTAVWRDCCRSWACVECNCSCAHSPFRMILPFLHPNVRSLRFQMLLDFSHEYARLENEHEESPQRREDQAWILYHATMISMTSSFSDSVSLRARALTFSLFAPPCICIAGKWHTKLELTGEALRLLPPAAATRSGGGGQTAANQQRAQQLRTMICRMASDFVTPKLTCASIFDLSSPTSRTTLAPVGPDTLIRFGPSLVMSRLQLDLVGLLDAVRHSRVSCQVTAAKFCSARVLDLRCDSPTSVWPSVRQLEECGRRLFTLPDETIKSMLQIAAFGVPEDDLRAPMANDSFAAALLLLAAAMRPNEQVDLGTGGRLSRRQVRDLVLRFCDDDVQSGMLKDAIPHFEYAAAGDVSQFRETKWN